MGRAVCGFGGGRGCRVVCYLLLVDVLSDLYVGEGIIV